MSGWRRVPVPRPLIAQAPKTRAWQREVSDGHLSVFAGPEPDGFHLSISHRTSDGRAAPDQYVNVHATTFHLWEIS